MPFASSAQKSWMYANKPDMAKRWEKHTPKGKKLPKKKTKSESVANRIDAVLQGEQPAHSVFVVSEFGAKLNSVLSELNIVKTPTEALSTIMPISDKSGDS